MKPWYEIVEPYTTIRSGQIEETEFTPDLKDIIEGKTSQYYQDPKKFFEITYMTRGLLRLFQNVQNKVMRGKGNAVIKLQTPFGGGKTHALIAVYHFVVNGKAILRILPESFTQIDTKILIIEGTHLNPLEGHKCENLCIQTLWGEIAYQLGGNEGYKQFEENDKKMISPGKEKLITFLKNFPSFILLLDEIAEYITKADGITVNDSNLGTQTLLFLQELTEVLSSISNALMIITLPVHDVEFFSEKTSNNLKMINQILGRVESTETPIERDEISKLIIKRLIDKCVFPEERDLILSYYIKRYQSNRRELPAYSANPNFIHKMRDSFPFHPNLIDTLFDKWSAISSFQGIRAILRILAKVLSQLWSSKTEINLICLGNVDLSLTKLRNEFLLHVKNDFNSILLSEVCGNDSKSRILDSNSLAWNNLASEISSTIFLSSFPTDGKLVGLTLSELKIRLIKPGIQTSLISEVIEVIKQTYWFLHHEDGRYFFSYKPNLNRTIQDIKELYRESYEEKMREVIKSCLGNTIKCYLWPKSSTEIPDDLQLKIIIVHPSTSINTLDEWIEKKGTSFRQNKNRILFTLPNKNALKNLVELTRTLLALFEIKKKLIDKNDDRVLHETFEVNERIRKIERMFSYNVRKTYSTFYDKRSTFSIDLFQTADEPLTDWLYRELISKEYLVKKLHYRKIDDLFLRNSPFILTKKIIEQFYIDPQQIKITSSKVIQKSICNGVKEGAFGIASIGEKGIMTTSFHFLNEINPQEICFSDNEILLRKDVSKEINDLITKNKKLKEIPVPEIHHKSYSQEIIKNLNSVVESPQKVKSLLWEVSNLDSKNLPLFYNGIIKPLQLQNTKITLELKIKVESEDSITESIMESKITETLHQLGIKMNKI